MPGTTLSRLSSTSQCTDVGNVHHIGQDILATVALEWQWREALPPSLFFFADEAHVKKVKDCWFCSKKIGSFLPPSSS